jgi:alkanesulfonate monooxygenase SsuD/methylene tetrahydromethanopterin reductase-like flavin-dependent oxidoreductase (luciferase family)
MQFGLFGSAAARRGGPEFDSSEGFRDFIEYNIEAEALGFHSTFVVEHHFTGYGQVSATLNLLTWLGARTRRLRLGTAVLVLPWHNPVLLAEQAATLDLLSGGRLDFGIGKGYRYNEFAGFCVPMEEADARFDECLEVILKVWTADEPSRIGAHTGHSTRSWSNLRRRRRRTRRSGWAPAARDRSARWPRRATICCSANMPRPRRSVTPSRCSKQRSRRMVAALIRCRSV